MDKQLSKLIDEAIELELNISNIYEIFNKSFSEDLDFWSKLASEEENHGTLLKNFSAKTPMEEVGRTVLTMPVFTSEISLEEVKIAMENVSTQDVNNWLSQNIGDTLFAKRKRAYNSIN